MDDAKVASCETAMASRCELATAGPFGPLDSVVNTFDHGLIGSIRDPKYHLRLRVNFFRNLLNFLDIFRTDVSVS